MTWFLAIATALMLAAIQFWVVAHHPEPAPDEPDAELKTRYAELVNPRALGLAVPLVALGLFLGGSALWQVPVMLLLVFSALEWALDFCAGCWAYGAWYRAFPPKMG